MLQPPENKNAVPASNANTYTPVKTSSAPMEQATIGRSLVIKGDISGAESLFVDGRIEGTVNIPENRVTVGRNGVVTADVNAREVVIMALCQQLSIAPVQAAGEQKNKQNQQSRQGDAKPNGDASKAAAATAGA